MDFLLSPELIEFRSVLQKFFSTEFDSDYLRQTIANRTQGGKVDFSEGEKALWSKMAELGLLAAALPEKYSGLGLGYLAAQVILEESVFALCPLPLFETLALAAFPLLHYGSDGARNSILPEVASGNVCLTGAFTTITLDGDGKLRNLPTANLDRTDTSGKTYFLNGQVEMVPAVAKASGVLILADILPSSSSSASVLATTNITPEVGLFLLKLPTDGLRHQTLETFDLLRDYQRLVFEQARVELISPGALSKNQIESFLDILSIFYASELIGVGVKALKLSIEHVKTRTQFRRPIGSFQAIQHKLADMYLHLEQARSLVRFACWCQENDPGQGSSSAIAAKGFASDFIPKLIEQAIQVHGGIGFTYEYDLHLYLRRALVISRSGSSSIKCYEALGSQN